MKTSAVLLSLLVACSLAGCAAPAKKRAPEVVASCFSDGEDQTQMCKTQRVSEDSKIITTRCIGSQNKIAAAHLRGKCVEKICADNNNTECATRGEFGVLEQYAELLKGRMFAEDQVAAPPPEETGKFVRKKTKGKKGSKTAAASKEIDVDPSVRLPKEPERSEPPLPKASAKVTPRTQPESSSSAREMVVVLKPAAPPAAVASVAPAVSAAKSRLPASVNAAEGTKKFCIAKTEKSAPEGLRGKCATRTCANGKCNYQGRKEVVDWATR